MAEMGVMAAVVVVAREQHRDHTDMTATFHMGMNHSQLMLVLVEEQHRRMPP